MGTKKVKAAAKQTAPVPPYSSDGHSLSFVRRSYCRLSHYIKPEILAAYLEAAITFFISFNIKKFTL